MARFFQVLALLSFVCLANGDHGRKLLWVRQQEDLSNTDELPSNSTVLVTGAAGFIGFHLAMSLHSLGNVVVGIDNFNAYYDVRLKEARAHKLAKQGVTMLNVDICDVPMLEKLFSKYKFDYVGHLAAQAGVRYSVKHPHDYMKTNVDCFVNLLEILRDYPNTYFTYASSSSVYGKDATIPFTEKDCSDHPTNVYGASKRMNEMLAFAYHHLYNIRSTGLRFFTVYGPWGRPDMAPFIFTDKVSKGEEIDVYHTADGAEMKRDFTYVDDIVDGIMRSMKHEAPYDVFNLGRGSPTSVPEFVKMIEKAVGQPAKRHDMEAHSAELPITFSNTTHANIDLNYKPKMSTEDGVDMFVGWYKWYQDMIERKTIPTKDTYLPSEDQL